MISLRYYCTLAATLLIMIKAIKLYTGPDGHSHFITGTLVENELHKANSIRFRESPAGSSYDWHNAPTEQYVISLTGTLEFETRLGEKFILKPGEVLIALDTTGSAHRWQMIDDQPWKRAYVAFDKNDEINFIPDEA
jgi:quercetin dioxygenase-like cupin family protein